MYLIYNIDKIYQLLFNKSKKSRLFDFDSTVACI